MSDKYIARDLMLEQQNNLKHVMTIFVHLPTAVILKTVTFMDKV